jgi:hypothetical protein
VGRGQHGPIAITTSARTASFTADDDRSPNAVASTHWGRLDRPQAIRLAGYN